MEHIPFALPSLDREEEEAVVRVLRSGWLTTGREALLFETEFGGYVGAPIALAVSSATAGLHLCLEALDVGPGSFVITTPFTFVASAEVIRYQGAHPKFADIDAETLNIDPVRIEELLAKNAGSTNTVAAVIPVHIGGRLCDMKSVMRLARAYGVKVVEDAAHSFPARSGGRHAGTFGSAGVFSFYATKPLTTGEGGMVVTSSKTLAKKMAVLRLHGINRLVWDRYHGRAAASWDYDITARGYKYNLPDTAAALGRIQLAKTDKLWKRRCEIAAAYHRELGDCSFLRLPGGVPGEPDNAWHLYILRIDPRRLSITRDDYMQRLMEAGVGVSLHYKPLHLMSYYKKMYGLKPGDFPVSLEAFRTCFSLPLYPGLSEEQVWRITGAVKTIGMDHYRAGSYGGTGRSKKG